MAIFKNHKSNTPLVQNAENSSDISEDASQGSGETRMWNAEEVRAAAEVAAAEWDAQCRAEEEAAEQDVSGVGENQTDRNRKGADKAGSGKSSKGDPDSKNKKSKKSKKGGNGKSSRRSLAARLALGIAVVGILGTGGYCGWRYYSEEIQPGRQYERAVELRDGGALDDAIQVFTRLGEWGDASEQVLVTELMKARNQIDVGSYEDALVTLAAVGDYAGTDELVTQALITEANQALSDLAYNKGLDLIKIYDYDAAADQFAAAQAYTEREDAAELQEACENAFDEVYAASFAEGRDADEDLQMTMYLWVHSVITPGEAAVPLGMQSDLSTGDINTNVFGQAYMNYVYYGEENEQIYTFSYAGSEKDAADESRQVFLVAGFSDDYEQVTTSKIYQDTGEVPAAPDIRLWNRVTDAETISAVQAGMQARLTMDLVASGELDAETYGNADHSFTAIETIDDGFTLRTAEEIAAEEQARAEEAAAEDSGDGDDDAVTDAEEVEQVLQAKAEAFRQQEEDERIAAQQAAVESLYSDYAIMVDAETGEILVSKAADTTMYPASMTKIMTILIAAERVTDLTDRVEITNDIINYAAERQLTTVGWSTSEEVTIADLLWGTALCSGADAAKALANYVAGSETNYVDLMNAKAEELGLGGTHFANCTGVYSDENYTTPHDMALILYAAVRNPLARTVLSTRQYTTTFTDEHPAGITITNSFLRNMDQDQLPGVVLSAKTGFVSKSMFCAASYMIADDGEIYICVTGHADTSAHCRADHAALYNAFAMPASHTDMEKYLQEILSGESANVGTIAAANEE